VDERLSVLIDGQPVEPLEVVGEHGNRVHVLDGAQGRLSVSYTAAVDGHGKGVPLTEQDRIVYARPSRYAESDRLLNFAAKEFGTQRSGSAIVQDVVRWVGSRLNYVPGSSGPTDGATDTLLSGAGVCRDYAHLVIAMLRALRVPARLTAVYAPGCDPMDFHAVVEAYAAGGWYVVDATALAPRSSLVRIATGRDAADTAFMTTVSGGASLDWSTVTAVADDGLPFDDLDQLVALR
jgi:transglutaminase-like putative cysteine protease